MEGAVRYCTRRKLTKTALSLVALQFNNLNSYFSSTPIALLSRKCIYDDKSVKYLVQVRDDVEAGDEKLKELEQEMKDWGIFDTDFSLGDALDEEEEKKDDPKPKTKMVEFPVVEGDETVVEYVGQYKKACLSRKALLKSTRERLEKDKAQGYEILSCHRLYIHAVFLSRFRGFNQLVAFSLIYTLRSSLCNLQGKTFSFWTTWEDS